MRTTIDLTEEAYHIAKTVARESGESLGTTVSRFITQSTVTTPRKPVRSGELPVFRCVRRVTTSDVRALDDDE